MARLQETYAKEIAPALMKKFNYKSVMQIPKLDKVVINVGCGEARDNPKIMDAILSDLAKITGQKPIVCKAKKSVANFKLREGMPIGAKVTLRGERMYEFVDRFFSVALPRVRDFRGINGNSFDCLLYTSRKARLWRYDSDNNIIRKRERLWLLKSINRQRPAAAA